MVAAGRRPISRVRIHCKEIIEGRHIDVQEIDAASNKRRRQHPPDQRRGALRSGPARYKVYIVDEVHMLSTGAFNAFLKTLEEPPPHARFIFATNGNPQGPV